MSDQVIQLLPDHIANQIAAGEVIQRPASIVKELLENAIDAGATQIDLIVKDAGRTLVQVIDNGKGMSPGDAQLCFARHATSKLKTADDLFHLTTKGFRGEALASIAAIAHVDLKTKRPVDEVGFHVRMEGSECKTQEAVVAPDGTNIEVRNLFYNVPARRNFLKSDSVEFKHILFEFERVVIPHTDIQFKLIHNGEIVKTLPAAKRSQRLIDLMGTHLKDKLIPVNEDTEIVQIRGFTIKPEAAKKTRGEQYFFVNNRYFRDPYFHSAVSKAYENLISGGFHPGYFLFLDIDPEKIDVNVHPTKTEIKFEEDRHIYAILMTAVRNSLGKFNIMPTLDFERETAFDVPYSHTREIPKAPQFNANPHYNPFHNTTSSPSFSSHSSSRSAAFEKVGFGSPTGDWTDFYPIEEEEEKSDTHTLLEVKESPQQLLVWGNYCVVPANDGWMWMHYRRAYERIVYDSLMEHFYVHPVDSQGLLFPYEAPSDPVISGLWNENRKIIEQLGFRFEASDQQILLTGLPVVLEEENVPQFLHEWNHQLALEQIDKGELAHHCVLHIAQSAACKKNLCVDAEAGKELMNRLMQTENQQFSPTGKRILRHLTFQQIENL